VICWSTECRNPFRAKSPPKCDAHHSRVARRPYFRVSAVIVESLLGRVGQQLPNDVAALQGAIVDLQMFVVVGGRERSVAPYEKLVRQANLSKTPTTPLPSGYVLVEANGEDWHPMRGVNASQRPTEE
jgi:hypothetical protein